MNISSRKAYVQQQESGGMGPGPHTAADLLSRAGSPYRDLVAKASLWRKRIIRSRRHGVLLSRTLRDKARISAGAEEFCQSLDVAYIRCG